MTQTINNNVMRIENLSSFEGKTIRWTVGAAEGNSDYEGIAKVEKVDMTRTLCGQVRPLVCKTIEGDDLNYAGVDYANEFVCYSDGDRFVCFEIIG